MQHRVRAKRSSTRPGLRFLLDNQPVRALLLVHVEALAIVASDALTRDDFGSANRTPLAGFLADLTRIAFRPTLDPKNSQVREQSKKRANRTEEPAIQIPDENRREEQHAQPQPHSSRRLEREHPEGFDVSVDRDVLGYKEIQDCGSKQTVFDVAGSSIDPARHLEAEPGRDNLIEKLS